MQIGIIGAGNVGGTLGRAWAGKGHAVMFGVRNPADAKVKSLLAQAGAGATAGKVAEAAAHGEVVALATPWQAAREALQGAGALSGKVLLDCTNPLKADLSGLELGHTTSGGEQVAASASGARVVKIFNTTGFNNMADPHYGEGAATMFFAGDDAAAKAVATRLAADLGFDPVDVGPLVQARLLEPLALLWIYLALVRGEGRDIAFRLMRR
jgi:predicted dinucleotide-binding enzyme